MEILGREREIEILASLLRSKKPEFLALYGRRRVGKTYLIKQFFDNKKNIFFNITGSENTPFKEQILNFTNQIGKVFFGGMKPQPGKNWNETFHILTEAIEKANKNKKIILFFDELPWLTTQNSKLLQNLAYFWNQYWSNDERIKLVVCGSSSSWIIHKIVKNKGGLHNRITREICLEPFNLYNTSHFLKNMGIRLDNQQILLIYMLTGGIPYYLSYIKKGLSAHQIIENLAFTKQGPLLKEFDGLFASLFNNHEDYIKAIRIIASRRYGIGKNILLESLGKATMGERGLKILKDLEEAGFIISFKPHFHKRQGIYYRVIDEYTLFYLKWIEPLRETLQERSLEKGNWQHMQNSPEYNNWLGYAFESICYKHLHGIRKALSINPTAIANTWRYIPQKNSEARGAQIDLLFDRRDNAITLCEIKYSQKPFLITKDYAENLKRKVEVFKKRTRTNKQLFIAFVAANGVKNNKYYKNLISCTAKLSDLFYKDEQ